MALLNEQQRHSVSKVQKHIAIASTDCLDSSPSVAFVGPRYKDGEASSLGAISLYASLGVIL